MKQVRVILLIYQTDYYFIKFHGVGPTWFSTQLWEYFARNSSNLLWSETRKIIDFNNNNLINGTNIRTFEARNNYKNNTKIGEAENEIQVV